MGSRRPAVPRECQERAQILTASMNAADKGRGQVPPEAMMAAATGLGARQTPARADARGSIEVTVTGLGYELVDVEREPRGLLRVTIDRLPGRSYPSGPTGDGAEFVTVDDCELVTRQLQYSLEVDGADRVGGARRLDVGFQPLADRCDPGCRPCRPKP